MRHQQNNDTSSCKAMAIKQQQVLGQKSVFLPVLAALVFCAAGMAMVYGLESYFGMTQAYGLETVFKLS